MVQLASIASTANRRVLPAAKLNVEGATPAAFGGAIGAGLGALGDSVGKVGEAMERFELIKQVEQDRLAEFDRQTTFVTFGSQQSEKLAAAAETAEGPAQDFMKGFMGSFDQDSAAFLEQVPERQRPAWQARMAQLRAGVAGDALKTELDHRHRYYNTTIDDSLEKLENGAMSSPAKLRDWVSQGEQLIRTSGLSVQEQEVRVLAWRGQVTVAAANGDRQQDPEGFIRRAGGTVRRAEGTTGVPGSVSAASPEADNVHAALIQQESGGRRGAEGPPTKYGRAHGLGQVLDSTGEDIARKLGVAWRPDLMRGTSDEAAAYQLKFSRAYFDEGLDKYGGDVRKALMYYHGGPDERKWGPKTRGYATQVLARAGVGPVQTASAGPQPGTATDMPPPEAGGAVVALDGSPAVDPMYAELPYEVRAQLIDAAQRDIDQGERRVAVAQQQQHAERLNGFLTELNDGKGGTADIAAARKAGWLTDYDEIRRAEEIVERRDKADADLTYFNGALATPGFTWNPFDDQQKKGVEAAVEARVKAGLNPAQAAFDVWQRTGILAEAGSVALRGSLISTDPAQVRSGATIAANMLARNPNAFAGVQGGDDIEKSALAFQNYVNGLGFSAEEAASRVAKANTPEARRAVKMGQPELAEFRKTLQKTNVGALMSNAFGGYFSIDPEFTSPEQRHAAAQDYADIAIDRYQETGNASEAQAYAKAQMQKLYGVVGGRLMKYPPTRAYPAIDGSQGYIFAQAAADIKAVTGRDIKPDRVYLMPLPTATAEAFRAGKRAPYEVHYIDTVGGQDVYRVLIGKAFYADPQAETARVSADRAKQIEEERRRLAVQRETRLRQMSETR